MGLQLLDRPRRRLELNDLVPLAAARNQTRPNLIQSRDLHRGNSRTHRTGQRCPCSFDGTKLASDNKAMSDEVLGKQDRQGSQSANSLCLTVDSIHELTLYRRELKVGREGGVKQLEQMCLERTRRAQTDKSDGHK